MFSSGSADGGNSGALYLGSGVATGGRGGMVSISGGGIGSSGYGRRVERALGPQHPAQRWCAEPGEWRGHGDEQRRDLDSKCKLAHLGASGRLVFSSGSASGGNSGALFVGSGAATGGRGGMVSISVGSGTSGAGGALSVLSGRSTVTTGGVLSVDTAGGHDLDEREHRDSQCELGRIGLERYAGVQHGHIERWEQRWADHRLGRWRLVGAEAW